jgi:hypothetical protein
MSVITIPFGYEELPDHQRRAIVPICIPTRDDDGRQIAWGWFEAVAVVQSPLRGLARFFLEDEWRVSELAESAVKIVWRNHGEDYGRSPSARVYAQAKWCAKDLKAGSARDRRGLNVRLEEFDQALRERLLVDPCNYDEQYGFDLDLAELGKQYRERGLGEIDQMLQLLRDGCNWKEIGLRLDRDPNVAQRRFRRWLNKAGQMLGIND